MKEIKKDLPVSGKQGDKENQTNVFDQDSRLKKDNPTQGPSTLRENGKEQTDTQKKEAAKEHQHDIKTPAAEEKSLRYADKNQDTKEL